MPFVRQLPPFNLLIGFNPRPYHVGFFMDRYNLDRFFLPVLQFSPVSIIPPLLHTHSLIYYGRYIASAINSSIKQHSERCSNICPKSDSFMGNTPYSDYPSNLRLRSSLWNVTQHRLVVSYRRFGQTIDAIFKGCSCSGWMYSAIRGTGVLCGSWHDLQETCHHGNQVPFSLSLSLSHTHTHTHTHIQTHARAILLLS